jgi:hypothetical protein
MYRKKSRLHCYPQRRVVGHNPANSINLEWIWVPLNLEISAALVSIDCTVPIAVFHDGKVGSYERIAGPVEQPCGQPVVLRNGEPLPVIIGRTIQVRNGALLKKAENIALILGLQNLLPFAAATDLWNQFVPGGRYASVYDRCLAVFLD